MTTITKYRSFDGIEFDDAEQCNVHESTLRARYSRLCGKTLDCVWLKGACVQILTTEGDKITIGYDSRDETMCIE